jgi:DNA replication ATP-dependent helicase Dna2
LLENRRKVVFLDTDEVPAFDARAGEVLHNEVEAAIIQQLAVGLMVCGVSGSSIGIISPYRAQLKVIRHLLDKDYGIEVHTVDKFQGRDKDCILVSLVRSNPNKNVSFTYSFFYSREKGN